jgi:hypothetical protein
LIAQTAHESSFTSPQSLGFEAQGLFSGGDHDTSRQHPLERAACAARLARRKIGEVWSKPGLQARDMPNMGIARSKKNFRPPLVARDFRGKSGERID